MISSPSFSSDVSMAVVFPSVIDVFTGTAFSLPFPAST